MSDARAMDQQARTADWASADARRRVRRRYAADWRLQAYGIIAISLAVGLLGTAVAQDTGDLARGGLGGVGR